VHIEGIVHSVHIVHFAYIYIYSTSYILCNGYFYLTFFNLNVTPSKRKKTHIFWSLNALKKIITAWAYSIFKGIYWDSSFFFTLNFELNCGWINHLIGPCWELVRLISSFSFYGAVSKFRKTTCVFKSQMNVLNVQCIPRQQLHKMFQIKHKGMFLARNL